MPQKPKYYIVEAKALPETFQKVAEVKRILSSGEDTKVNRVAERVGVSRSAYYKYKDYVFPFYEASRNKTITLNFLLEDKRGVLSSVLNKISSEAGNILTINQGIPTQGVANTTISIETNNLSVNLEILLDQLRMVDGVKRLEILGQE